jgi:hypothetical protein
MIRMEETFEGHGVINEASHMVSGTCCPLAITYLFCYHA